MDFLTRQESNGRRCGPMQILRRLQLGHRRRRGRHVRKKRPDRPGKPGGSGLSLGRERPRRATDNQMPACHGAIAATSCGGPKPPNFVNNGLAINPLCPRKRPDALKRGRRLIVRHAGHGAQGERPGGCGEEKMLCHYRQRFSLTLWVSVYFREVNGNRWP